MASILDCHIHCSENKDDLLNGYARANGLKYDLNEILKLMDEHDVSSGLLLSPPLKSGNALPSDEIVMMCRRSRDKLFPIITVEPSIEKVDESLKLAKENKGYAKGFKILLGYFPIFPSDEIYSKIYDYAESENLPVMFHTGDTAVSTGSLVHAKPLGLDILANKREGLKIIACHFGNPWLHDVAELLYKHPNMYADISGLFTVGSRYSNRYMEHLANMLSEAIYFVGNADKILFGTDYPIERYSDAIKFTRSLTLEPDDIERILSKNAKRVFQI